MSGIRRFALWFVLMLGVALAACEPQQTSSPSSESGGDALPDFAKPYAASVSGLNFSTAYIDSFSITNEEGRTGGGPNIYPSPGNGKRAGGGKEMCCAYVPAKWHEGMSVTVRWERDIHPYDAKNRSGDQWLYAVAKVPPYTRLTRGFWVRFLPDDRISVQVNDQELYIPDPVENHDQYIVQGVLDEEANQAMHAARERERKSVEEYLQQLREQEAKAAQQGETQ